MTPAVARKTLVRRALLLTAVILASGGTYFLTDTNRGSSTGDDTIVTFNRDIAPIVNRNCVVCHRPDRKSTRLNSSH